LSIPVFSCVDCDLANQRVRDREAKIPCRQATCGFGWKGWTGLCQKSQASV
jgi:hypothetical protein